MLRIHPGQSCFVSYQAAYYENKHLSAILYGMRRISTLLIFILFSCAGKQPTPPLLAPIAPNDSIAPAPNLTAATENLEEAQISGKFDLKEALSHWIKSNENSNYEEVAAMANKMIQRHGYPMKLDVSKVLKKGQKKIKIQAGKKNFIFYAGKELSLSSDICGERYLHIPVKLLPGKKAALISENKEYIFSLKKFRREKFKVSKKNKLIAEVESPEPGEPIGITPNGRGVLMRFPLDESITSNWWTNLAKNLPHILGDDPYLVLKIESEHLSFETNPLRTIPQDFEVEESPTETLHWRFLPSNFTLELSSHCGSK